MKKSIGEKSKEVAKQYFKLYKQFLVDDNIDIRTRAENLAMHDIVCKMIMYEFARDELDKLIVEHKLDEKIKLEKQLNQGA